MAHCRYLIYLVILNLSTFNLRFCRACRLQIPKPLVSAHTTHLHEPHLDSIHEHPDDLLFTPNDLRTLPQTAVCLMQSHAPQYNTSGYIRFTQTRLTTSTQTVIAGRLSGLTSNQKHAFHIHELGDLTDTSNGCVSLAGHYNP